jgi:S-formylglutathione hydrolase FrmB
MFRIVISVLVYLAVMQSLIAQGNSKKNTAKTEVIKRGNIIAEKLNSNILKENLVGLKTTRDVMVYLPPQYSSSRKSYPVVYYCHSIYGNAGMILYDSSAVHELLERAFASETGKEFIFVVADYSSGNIGSLYENSITSGRWLDFTTQELVPFIDGKYRTIRHRDSRGVTGDFMGGRGALKLGMSHSDIFGVVYGLHPVALGVGTRPWTDVGVNWDKVFNAKSFADLGGDKYCETWVAICQAFLPNPSRPPFYCDYFMKKEGEKLVVDPQNLIKIQQGFHLDEMLNETYKNLQSLRGLAFDWARYDGNYDHVHAARAFTRKLDDFGIEHEAEEYRGTPWNKTWGIDGRFNTRALPFMLKHLVFQ